MSQHLLDDFIPFTPSKKRFPLRFYEGFEKRAFKATDKKIGTKNGATVYQMNNKRKFPPEWYAKQAARRKKK